MSTFSLIKSAFILLLLCGPWGHQQVSAQPTECKPFDFNIAPSFEIGINTADSTSADFNNDGNIDIASSNFERRSVSVVYGDGGGGFTPAQFFPTVADAYSIASGDFNSDGSHDLIVGSGLRNELAILLNDGTGRFLAPTIYSPTTPFPNSGEYYDLQAGDFNGDGKTDIAAIRLQSNRQLNIFLGSGLGNFSVGASLNLTGSEAVMKVGNLNSDTISDIIVSGGDSFTQRNISFVFGAANSVFALTYGFSVLEKARAFTISDINNDSHKDFTVAFEDTTTPTQPYLKPWLGNGSGVFTAGTAINTEYFLSPTDITSADFDGDGNQDLAAPLSGYMVIVLYGQGNGNFNSPNYWAIQTGANAILNNDVNHDNRPDLISIQQLYISSNSLSVLTNLPDRKFSAPRSILYGLSQLDAADFNNDGRMDFTSSRKSDFVTISSVNVNLSGPDAMGPDIGVPTRKALNAMTVGDFNGDGFQDAVTAHSNNERVLAVYFGNGTGNLAAGVTTSLNVPFQNVISGNFNLDGKDDVFVVNENGQGYSMLSNGNGTFTVAANFPVMLQGNNVKFLKGDFNEDGKVDLVISNGTVNLWLGDGTGQFARSTVSFPTLNDVVTGDFDGDGHLDLAGFDLNWVLRGIPGIGNGQFGVPYTSTLQTGGDRRSLVAGDFNNDGLDDLAFVILQTTFENLVIVPSTGSNLGWGSPVSYSVAGLSGYTASLFAADYNGDGLPDIGYNAETSRGILYSVFGQKPCMTVGDVSITESDAGPVNASFGVSLSAPSTEIVRVNYTLSNGTAVVGTDLQNISGRLEIPAGQTSGVINVPINGDLLDEFDENFTLKLSSPHNAFVTKSVGVGTIVDNDAEPNLTISDVTANEGSSFRQFTFTVSLSAASGKPISLAYSTADGTALVSSDYIASSGNANIVPGNTTLNLNVTVTGDSTHEPNEHFFLNISAAINSVVVDGVGQGTITNDDPVPTLSTFTPVSVLEGNTGQTTRNVQFQLSNPSYLPVTLNVVTSDGTATGSLDYNPLNTSIVIPPGSQGASTTVQIIGDRLDEPNETFFVNFTNLANATLNNLRSQIIIVDDDVRNPVADFDGDGKSDLSVYRPSEGNWYVLRSTSGYNVTSWGLPTDIVAPGDFDGDGKADFAVFRPSEGNWYIANSNGTFTSGQFGLPGDIPVPADYDGDGKDDRAVFRPSNSTWYILNSNGFNVREQAFGLSGDRPVPGDYDGDLKADLSVFRPSNGTWYRANSGNGNFVEQQWGLNGDIPVNADYDGDNKQDYAVFRPSAASWFILNSTNGSYNFRSFGLTGDVPVPGDYDGNGFDDIAVFRNGFWYIIRSAQVYTETQFGLAGDTSIPTKHIP
ncbi:MAG: FG-GAP-like repeat-containing protein [Pyrinomonadaceae bacterium]